MHASSTFEDLKILKLIVVGNSHVGKSSLITRFFDKRFGKAVQTVGVDYRIMKNLKVSSGNTYQVSIWDTAGQEQFQSIVRFSCKGSNGAIICFDLSDLQSLLSTKEWTKFVRQHCPENTLIILVGTKLDKENKLEQTQIESVLAEIQSSEKQQIKYTLTFILFQFGYFETSAKTKEGVNEMFLEAFELCAANKEHHASDIKIEEIDSTQSLHTSKAHKLSSLKASELQNKNDGGCC